tara:strand:+ start:3492 stop:5618 length:2127 start_codon:yes stop_codon:yes gene_type:complete
MENEDDLQATELYMDDAESSYIEDSSEDDTTDEDVGKIVHLVSEKFRKSKDARDSDEERWLQSYRNYRGLYGPDVAFTNTEKSRVFVKITKTKVLAAYGQLVDVLFGNNRFPITIDPTTLPEGIQAAVHFQKDSQPAPAAPSAPGMPPAPPAAPVEMPKPSPTALVFNSLPSYLQDKFEPVQDRLTEGTSGTPESVNFFPAMEAAKKMEKKIHDQLEESNASKQLRTAAFECALFGTGVMKGPFAIDKEYANWDEEGNYNPTIKTVPKCSSVSIWNFYPDPDANNMDEAEYVVERHKMSRSQIRALKKRPFFRENAIDDAIANGENYKSEYWETLMQDDSLESAPDRFEVLEFWGYVDTDLLEEYDVDIPKELKDSEQVSVNIWVCQGRVLRLVMNPFTPTYLPYYAVPYEVNPYSFFGVGLAENMDDTQTLMNGFMRMAVDNAALSGNLILEIDETNMAPGQDLSVYPGKVFTRQGGAPGQSIFGTKFPNVSNENMQMFDKARVLADESTGFPSFAHGQTGVQGVGRTASGISMLMSAANGSIRTVIKNVDDYLLAPLGKSFFNFNMQFDFDPEIKGDLEVKAQGTSSLMANEVRSQRLMQFLGVVQNPMLAPFTKIDYLIREIAESMDLDPDKVTNNMSEAALMAEVLKKMQKEELPVGPDGSVPDAPAGIQATDTQGSGGGTIGTGSVPTPGETGFPANTGEGGI